jgi:hypothetical protein
MKLQQDQKYMSKTYTFPSENIPQNLKNENEKEYYLNCANAIVWKYVRNKCYLPYEYGSDQDSIQVLRAYMKGTNSPDKYKSRLIGQPDRNGKRKTTMNISWRVPQILSEKMEVVKGHLLKIIYDIRTQAIDMQAVMDKELIVANLKLMIDDKIRALPNIINESAGREVIPQNEDEVTFSNEQQVDMFAKIGGVLLQQESSIKILLDHSMTESDWMGIYEKLVEDIIAAAICGTVIYNDAGCETPKVEWVDIDRAIIPYSDYNDHRDITWGGYIRQMSIAELRKESGLSNKEVMDIARRYSRDEKTSQYISDFYIQAQSGYGNEGFGMNMIDSLIVDVADVKWIGTYTDTITKVKRKKEGNIALNKVGDTYELSAREIREGKELNKYSRQCVYKAKLVIGTDYVFHNGLEYNQIYKKDDNGNMKVVFPFSFIRTGSTSITSKAIGFFDDLAMAVYKKRTALKKLPPPPGVYIEQSAFQNVDIGGNKLTPLQSMKLLQDEGYLIGNSQNLWGNTTTGRSPITEIPSGIISQLTLFNSEIEFNTQQIERATGINEIFSAATPSSETGLGVSKIAINATMNAIYPIVRALERVEEKSLIVAAKKWQISSLGMDEPGRKPMPYDRALRYIKIGAGRSFNEYMIKIKPGPTDEEKAMLMQEIRALQDIRRQSGVGGIRPSDYFMIYEMVRNGNIEQARLYLAQVEEYIKEMDDRKAMENQQFTFQSQAESNQQAAENEFELMQAEGQIKGQTKAQEIQMQLEADMILQKQKAQDERRTIAMSNVYGWGADNYNSARK